MFFDHDSGREELAGVTRVLVDDACGYWLATFKARAWIEVVALTAGVQLGSAIRTGTIGTDAAGDLRAA